MGSSNYCAMYLATASFSLLWKDGPAFIMAVHGNYLANRRSRSLRYGQTFTPFMTIYNCWLLTIWNGGPTKLAVLPHLGGRDVTHITI